MVSPSKQQNRYIVGKSHINKYPLILFTGIYLNTRGTWQLSVVGSVYNLIQLQNFENHPLEERKSEKEDHSSEQFSVLAKRTDEHLARGNSGGCSYEKSLQRSVPVTLMGPFRRVTGPLRVNMLSRLKKSWNIKKKWDFV